MHGQAGKKWSVTVDSGDIFVAVGQCLTPNEARELARALASHAVRAEFWREEQRRLIGGEP